MHDVISVLSLRGGGRELNIGVYNIVCAYKILSLFWNGQNMQVQLYAVQLVIFPINVSFREYYVFISNAAAASGSAAAASPISLSARKLLKDLNYVLQT